MNHTSCSQAVPAHFSMNVVHGQLQGQYMSLYNDKMYIFDKFMNVYEERSICFPAYQFKPCAFTQ